MFEGLKSAAARVWGRKTFITLICLGLGTIVDIYSKNGLSTNLMSLMGLLAGAYAVGNSVENHAASKTTIAQIESQSSNDPRIAGLENQVSIANSSLATVLDTLGFIIKATGLDKPAEYQNEVAKNVDSNQAKREAVKKVLAS